MLVLYRKQGESVQIGDDIVVTIVRLGDGNVRLGFDAPKDVKIVRSEPLRYTDGTTERLGHGSPATEGA